MMHAPPDIEVAVVACLGVDPDVWVGTRYPAQDNPGGVIRVSATGGSAPKGRVAIEQTVLVECWHDDEGEAAKIARRAWARLDDASSRSFAGVEFKFVSSAGISNYPDPSRPAVARFQFLTSISTRTVEVTP